MIPALILLRSGGGTDPPPNPPPFCHPPVHASEVADTPVAMTVAMGVEFRLVWLGGHH